MYQKKDKSSPHTEFLMPTLPLGTTLTIPMNSPRNISTVNFCMHMLHLGSKPNDSGNGITISHQTFATVTNVSGSFLFCSNEMGMIGLRCHNTDDFGYPKVMSNIMKHVNFQLFALYLNGKTMI